MDESLKQNNNITNDKKDNNKNNENNKEYEVKRNPNPDIEFSESIKLKDLTDKKSNVINYSETKLETLKYSNQELENQTKIYNIFQELSKKTIYTYEIKKYGNSILIGSLCHSLTFILFGLYKTRLIADEYNNIWSFMALFGGLGQTTAGIMELMKGREFPSFIYLIYGIYCFSHYCLRIMIDRFGRYDLCIYDIACFLLSFPIILYSLKINLIFLLQSISVSLYFLFCAIGEGIDEYILIELVGGIFLIISGVLSFYIFLSQSINPCSYNFYIKTFPFDINNKIDFVRQIQSKEHKN